VRMPRTTRPDRRSLRPIALGLVLLACSGLIAVGSARAASGPGRVSRLKATCAGDVVRGKAKVDRPGSVLLRLLWKRSARSKFVVSRKTASIRARRTGFYRFKFDVSAMNGYAYAYRIRASSGARSGLLKTVNCGPGLQVPEVPVALLLPLSLLLVVGVPLALRRRRAAVEHS
jgi:hypothetical protein